MIESTIQDAIAENGSVLRMTDGHSMMPMIKDRVDPVVIGAVVLSPRVNDVILTKLRDDAFILHRLIRISGGNFITRGDNCLHKDKPVTADGVIGVLSGFYRGEKYVDCKKSFGYKLYVILWARGAYPLRVVFWTLRKAGSAVKRRLFKRK